MYLDSDSVRNGYPLTQRNNEGVGEMYGTFHIECIPIKMAFPITVKQEIFTFRKSS